MTIRQQGGVFGRNPTFNNVEADGTLTVSGQTTFNSNITIQNDNAPKISILDSNGGFAAATFTSENGGRDLAIFAPQDIIFDQNGLETARFLLGGGLTFNGDTAAANALDDYEEGTWTPVFADASSGGNVSPSQAALVGTYTKVGNLVVCRFKVLNINTSGMTAGNDFFIRGFPFLSQGTTYNDNVGTVAVERITFTGAVALELPRNETFARLVEYASGADDDYITVGEVTTNLADITATICYTAA